MILLLSGGMDSVAILSVFRPKVCLFVDYRQPAAEAEYKASKFFASHYNSTLFRIKMNLTDTSAQDLSFSDELYFPFRNQLLITIAGYYAAKIKERKILIGSTHSDKHFKDNDVSFVEKINDLMKFQDANISLVAPAINHDSIEYFQNAKISEPLYHHLHSCNFSNDPCGTCSSCIKLRKAIG